MLYHTNQVSSLQFPVAMSYDAQQQSLFSVSEQRSFTPVGPRERPSLEIDPAFLQRWKSDIFRYQQRILTEQTVQQPSLLGGLTADPNTDNELATAGWEAIADPIIPFDLELHNFFFFQWPADHHPDSACLYFVMDTTASLLLYVGETCHANQRWKGVHDCKQYVLNYQSLHFQHNIPTSINTGFWWDAPTETPPRQQLESVLIRKWRSPFNKENWKFWNTPFVRP
ncbi:MAG: GIY-YIG nuclease family protein [Leptolyngbyaceae bacterium]|nr:GIY-YIG nuclease family protein [Leptolyngbyaceae bacterium]